MNIQWMTHCRLQLTPPLSPMLQCSVHSTSYNVISYYWQPLPLWRSMYWTLNPFIWSEQNISLKMDTCLFFSVHNVCFSCPMREYKFLILDFLSQKKKIIFELKILKYSEQQRHDNEGLDKFGFSFFSVFIFIIPQPKLCRTHERREQRWSEQRDAALILYFLSCWRDSDLSRLLSLIFLDILSGNLWSAAAHLLAAAPAGCRPSLQLSWWVFSQYSERAPSS